MNTNKHSKITFSSSFGISHEELGPTFPQSVPEKFTLNSPVGISLDHKGNLWVCDVGNNRIVIFSPDLKKIISVIACLIDNPQCADGNHQLLMPFHVCPHPEKDWMYVSDLGHGRIVVFDYGKSLGGGAKEHYAKCVKVFDDAQVIDDISVDNLDAMAAANRDNPGEYKKNHFNGIVLVADDEIGCCLYAADELYHRRHGAPGSGLDRGRIVRFSDEGAYLAQFQGVQVLGGKLHDLRWPQGLSTDRLGNLYIANTGCDEIIKCDPKSPIDADLNLLLVTDEDKTQFHSLDPGQGNSYLTTMRSVSVIRDKVFISSANTLTVYDKKGDQRGMVVGEFSNGHTDSSPQRFGSLKDFAYGAVGGFALSCPYQVCAGKTENLYYITEPFLSKVVKVNIELVHNPYLLPQACQIFQAQGIAHDAFDYLTSAKVLAKIDGRRRQGEDQLNVVSAVTGFDVRPKTNPNQDASPARVQDQFHTAFYNLVTAMVDQNPWWKQFTAQPPSEQPVRLEHLLFAIDMGNWAIKSFDDHEYASQKRLSCAGTIAAATWLPQTPLLGQICPGTPLLITTNASFGIGTIYQFNQQGKLVKYGMPFGWGSMKSPQGIAVSENGEIHIADPVARKVWKWRILSSGWTELLCSFAPSDAPNADGLAELFMPTDVAIDSRHRVYVTDQGSSTVRVFDANGKQLLNFGQLGYWDGAAENATNFCLPTSLAINGEHLIINDLVNRALKIFSIGGEDRAPTLSYKKGIQLFAKRPEQGGLWMPFFIYADQANIYVPDCTFNVINKYAY